MSIWSSICVGLGVLLLPGGSLLLLAWLLRGDGFRYSIRCGTCGTTSGDRRHRRMAERWAQRHAKQNPACNARAMIGNKK